jgi:hypothetical protein
MKLGGKSAIQHDEKLVGKIRGSLAAKPSVEISGC